VAHFPTPENVGLDIDNVHNLVSEQIWKLININI